MKSINDGGPAFPEIKIETEKHYEGNKNIRIYKSGMTLRDYFAGQALMGILGNSSIIDYLPSDLNGTYNIENYAYKYADAMLAEREKRDEDKG